MRNKDNNELKRIVGNLIDYGQGRDMVNEAFAALEELHTRAEMYVNRVYAPDQADIEEARREWAAS